MIPKLFISPSLEDRVGEIDKILSGVKVTKNHPDLLYFESDSKLGVEQAREIKEHFSIRPHSAEGRVVVLEEASALTPEAQNALLKTFEEAPEKAVILIGTTSEQDLLPTILSRCEIIFIKNPEVPSQSTSEVGFERDIEKLINSSLEERFEYIEKLKDRAEFLQSLILYFHRTFRDSIVQRNGQDKNYQAFLKELLEAEKWAKQNVNIRAILEYLMLVMPTED